MDAQITAGHDPDFDTSMFCACVCVHVRARWVTATGYPCARAAFLRGSWHGLSRGVLTQNVIIVTQLFIVIITEYMGRGWHVVESLLQPDKPIFINYQQDSTDFFLGQTKLANWKLFHLRVEGSVKLSYKNFEETLF